MRVLVTRPEPGTSKTALRLRELGHEPVELPLTRIVASAQRQLPDPSGFGAVVLTSANALMFGTERLAALYGHLPCFTVGQRTADAASTAGFRNAVSANGDVHALVDLLTAKLPAGSRLLYLCGELRRPMLENALGRLGYAAVAFETYRTEALDHAPEDVAAVLAGRQPVAAALVYSRFGAERLSALVSIPAAAPHLHDIRVICMSDQVAGGLSAGLRDRAEIASSPDDDALLALLGRAA